MTLHAPCTRRLFTGLLLVCLTVLAVAPVSARDEAQPTLLVFAAASLKNAMDGVVSAYEREHDVDVKVSYAGSSTLARQIERGAPAQLYVSANQDWMDLLAQQGRIDKASRADLLTNSLVLVAPRDRHPLLRIEPHFAIVAALGDRYLAMANTDAVPAGIYGRQALTSLGVWQALEGHIAQAEDVRAALALVARDEAPLGVVYSSDAVAEKDVRVVDTFPADSHDAIVYPAALVAGPHSPAAAAFLSYLQSEGVGEIFRKWGFRLADAGAD